MQDTQTAIRPRFTTHRAVVTRKREIGPHFVRVTFGELRDYDCVGIAPKVKIFLPDDADHSAAARELTIPTVGVHGFEYPDDAPKPIVRTYTIRAHRRELCEVDIDFVVHSDGPAGRWVTNAVPGDVVGLTNAAGNQPLPELARSLLLLGDVSALPAIMTILESLTTDQEAITLLITDSPENEIPLEAAADGRARWIHGSDEETMIEELRQALSAHQPDYVWAAGEAGSLREVRHLLRLDIGYSPMNSHIVGYWKRKADADEVADDVFARMHAAIAEGRNLTPQELDELTVDDVEFLSTKP